MFFLGNAQVLSSWKHVSTSLHPSSQYTTLPLIAHHVFTFITGVDGVIFFMWLICFFAGKNTQGIY